MNKLALNFICKNESHVILRMLNSIKGVYDLIVANDTGSTDGTQELIKKFGEENNIPTFVFERSFDNFENSRNFAMQKLYEVVKDLGWDPSKVWGGWLDCDEVLVTTNQFSKNQFNKDFYMIIANLSNNKYTRNTFFRLSKKFRWYGVVHEFIVCDDPTITTGKIDNIEVVVQMDGNSWQGDTSLKYLNHAHTLEKYISENREDPRWIFYTAQSYHDSSLSNNIYENEERIRRAIKYYKERVSRLDGYHEERSYAQFRVGVMMHMLEEPWSDTMVELLKAYSMDNMRAEPIKAIVDYYMSMNEWNIAYLYSKFLKVNFSKKSPYPNRLLFIDESLYEWKILDMHSSICFQLGKIDEAKVCFNELLQVMNQKPNLFNQEDILKIKSNAQLFK